MPDRKIPPLLLRRDRDTGGRGNRFAQNQRRRARAAVPFRSRYPRIATAFDWLISIAFGLVMGLVVASSIGCGPMKKLVIPGPCHAAELVPQDDGSYRLSPNPCEVPRRP